MNNELRGDLRIIVMFNMGDRDKEMTVHTIKGVLKQDAQRVTDDYRRWNDHIAGMCGVWTYTDKLHC